MSINVQLIDFIVKGTFYLCLIFITSLLPSLAQADSHSILYKQAIFDCSDMSYEQDMLACAEKHLELATADMDSYILQLQQDPIVERELLQLRLEKVQATWANYRDQSCSLEAIESETGTGYGSIYTFCLLKYTQQRLLYFKEMVESP